MGFISLRLERRLEQGKYCHGGRKTLWRKKEIYIDCIWKKIPKEGEREGVRIKNKDLRSVKPTGWKERGRGRHVLLKQFTTTTPSQAVSGIPFSICFLQLAAQCTLSWVHFGPQINSSKKWQWNFHPQEKQGGKTPGAFPAPQLCPMQCSGRTTNCWGAAGSFASSCFATSSWLGRQRRTHAPWFSPVGSPREWSMARQCQPAPGPRGCSWHLDKPEQCGRRGKQPVVCAS